MSEESNLLSKKDLIINVIISVSVLVLGLILLEMGFNLSFESENETIRAIFEIITFLGEEETFIVFLTISLLAIDMRFGKRLIVSFMISMFFNSFLKDVIKDPRPHGLEAEMGYGFPSGHTQGSTAFWGFTLYYKKNEADSKKQAGIISAICTLLIIAVSISRLIIGVHDLQDVVGGFLIGMLILDLYLLLAPSVEKLSEKSLGLRIILGFIAAFSLWLVMALLFPAGAEAVGQGGGILVAASICFPLETKYIAYKPQDLPAKKKILAALVGVVFSMVGYLGLSEVFDLIPGPAWILRFVRYVILGVLLSLFVPWILKKIVKQ
ncbi:MAG: phosphatase PAP2 family protein [Candidatus Lokiarchaeota archaeon]|nr:phosphatase PAP2 family protein [Candidatus Lokiarchaeota archaeon]